MFNKIDCQFAYPLFSTSFATVICLAHNEKVFGKIKDRSNYFTLVLRCSSAVMFLTPSVLHSQFCSRQGAMESAQVAPPSPPVINSTPLVLSRHCSNVLPPYGAAQRAVAFIASPLIRSGSASRASQSGGKPRAPSPRAPSAPLTAPTSIDRLAEHPPSHVDSRTRRVLQSYRPMPLSGLDTPGHSSGSCSAWGIDHATELAGLLSLDFIRG